MYFNYNNERDNEDEHDVDVDPTRDGQLTDDLYVEYHLFVDDDSTSQAQTVDQLERLRIQYTEYLSTNHIRDYIWQRDPFFLKIYSGQSKTTKAAAAPPHLYGRTRFDDAIDDEWFIVYLLMQLTRQFTNISVTVRDNDGEFLLIESAQTLPKWMKPMSTHNRVFIRNGHLRIIPIASSPSELDMLPYRMDLVSALTLLRRDTQSSSHSLDTSPPIQTVQAIDKRLSRFINGKYMKDQSHVALVRLPVDLAFLLKRYPQLVSNIVHCFYNRDADDMAAVSTMKRFPVRTTLDQGMTMVDTKIRFTRCLYSQLRQQRFNQPRQFPPLPRPTAPEYQAASLGVKVHCGAEMMYRRKTHDVLHSASWKAYLQRLKQSDYFGGEVEGSKLYNERMIKAKEEFKKQTKSASTSEQVSSLASFMDEVLAGQDQQSMLKLIQESDDKLKESSDKWLDKIPSRLEDLLTEFENANGSSDGGDKNKNPMDNMTKQFQRMMEQHSSIDGVDFGAPKSKESAFDPEKFMSILKNIVGIDNKQAGNNINDGDDSSDDEMYDRIEDYGEEGDYKDDDDDGNNNQDDDDDEDDDDDDFKVSMEDTDYDDVYLSNLLPPRRSKMENVMHQMDMEIANTPVGQSFEKVQYEGDEDKDPKTLEADKINRPVDLNFNLVKNILGSLSSQQGLAGPASNILKELIDSKKK
ncbi:hypothetical protein SAMD00019534_116110 [Acytostelium subglobosum LB1]|uniref:hypothetical protein n=1 Tax=Acytostelium subglobosum LB1 TaxID=1410327 RepID=UPI000644EA44|nr:hypothetical protein SAMD00019534_116110 [Acytostelium subglobosum LB1]GAM28435.1 hypothetical protein SAMD00019534_116110 [Acytostelium subglobosum LB1]|eukprot:XP_012748752.1 hypothetical protein SAMD00019534_116110 [Acytostelium subglobosum LB1]